MRLLLTALHCPKGELDVNAARARDLLARGRQSNCDLVLLPEMSLTGYRAEAAVALDAPAVTELVECTRGGPSLSFGLVEARPEGAPYITQVVAADGRLAVVHRKTGLGEGEAGLFHPGTRGLRFDLHGTPCAFAVCAEIGTAPPFGLEATLVLGPAAPGLYGDRRVRDEDWRRGFDWWRSSVIADARRFLPPQAWLAVSTQAGATDDEDFPGWAALVGPGGTVVAELEDWRDGVLVVDVPPTP